MKLNLKHDAKMTSEAFGIDDKRNEALKRGMKHALLEHAMSEDAKISELVESMAGVCNTIEEMAFALFQMGQFKGMEKAMLGGNGIEALMEKLKTGRKGDNDDDVSNLELMVRAKLDKIIKPEDEPKNLN